MGTKVQANPTNMLFCKALGSSEFTHKVYQFLWAKWENSRGVTDIAKALTLSWGGGILCTLAGGVQNYPKS